MSIFGGILREYLVSSWQFWIQHKMLKYKIPKFRAFIINLHTDTLISSSSSWFAIWFGATAASLVWAIFSVLSFFIIDHAFLLFLVMFTFVMSSSHLTADLCLWLTELYIVFCKLSSRLYASVQSLYVWVIPRGQLRRLRRIYRPAGCHVDLWASLLWRRPVRWTGGTTTCQKLSHLGCFSGWHSRGMNHLLHW